jgi:cysteine synthase A
VKKSSWINDAVRKINADLRRSADTHLIKVHLPATPGIHFYMKDESTHITGSLKHRLARSLYLYGLCNGWIHQDTTVIEASSGDTAISEAYFAQLLGLRFIAVMAKTTSPEKMRRIIQYGGEYELVDDPHEDRERARQLARELNGHFMDQFTFAERATDWRGNNNIAESIFEQLADEPCPVPSWVVCGVGTGGTSATLGRYIKYYTHDTQVCVVDPENSVFYDCYHTGDTTLELRGGSGVEGIGRPEVGPSFIPTVIDRMIKVPNAASYAAIHLLEEVIGKKCGGSTGTNLYGAFKIIAEMVARGQVGSIVTLICDSGELYLDTYYNDTWLQEHGCDVRPHLDQLRNFYERAVWEDVGQPMLTHA